MAALPGAARLCTYNRKGHKHSCWAWLQYVALFAAGFLGTLVCVAPSTRKIEPTWYERQSAHARPQGTPALPSAPAAAAPRPAAAPAAAAPLGSVDALSGAPVLRGNESSPTASALGPSAAPNFITLLSGFVPKRAYPHDHHTAELCMWISVKYKFIGLQLPEVDRGIVLRALRESICGVPYDTNTACRDFDVLNHGQGKDGALNHFCELHLPSKEQWRDYFVFAFVSNPIERRMATFRYCVADFERCEACTKVYCGRCGPRRCAPFHESIFSPSNESYVDYIGHRETLRNDLSVIFAEIERRHRYETGQGIPWYDTPYLNEIETGPLDSLIPFFTKCPGCVQRIAEAYQRDIELFDYSAGAPEVPPSAVVKRGALSLYVDKTAKPHDFLGPNGLCVWVSDKYKFIGIKFAKTGGSTLLKALRSAFCGLSYSDPFGASERCSDPSVLDHGQDAPFTVSTGEVRYPACRRELPPVWKWESYFVFAFVRSPFLRRASMVRYCMDGHVCEACQQRACGRCSLSHCEIMHRNVVSPGNDSYVDFIGHTETLQEDLNEVLQEVQRRHVKATGGAVQWLNSTDVTKLWVNKANGAQTVEKGHSFAPFARCPACINTIWELYGRDITLFGYEMPSF